MKVALQTVERRLEELFRGEGFASTTDGSGRRTACHCRHCTQWVPLSALTCLRSHGSHHATSALCKTAGEGESSDVPMNILTLQPPSRATGLGGCAPSVRLLDSGEEALRLLSSRACHRTRSEADYGCADVACSVAHACRTIVSRRARLHCMTICRIGVVLCVCEALERG